MLCRSSGLGEKLFRASASAGFHYFPLSFTQIQGMVIHANGGLRSGF